MNLRSCWVSVLVVSTLCQMACNPRVLPGFKQEAKRQEKRITKETEEAIRKSPELQELDQLCRHQIPRPQDFVLERKYRDYVNATFLGYAYRSNADYPTVKNLYLKYFGENGWKLTKQKDGGWGPAEVEFRNERFSVTIYDKGIKEEGTYDLVCTRVK